jgi:hypothetical protein
MKTCELTNSSFEAWEINLAAINIEQVKVLAL